MEYLCLECTETFESNDELKDRKCPHCKSNGDRHKLLSMTRLSDMQRIQLAGLEE